MTLLSGAAIARPLGARAQQPGKVWRIGVLETRSAALNAANFDAFRQGMRALGYVEGQNLVIDYRSADGLTEKFPGLAAELVRLKVDLILTGGTPAALAAKNATATIPIVMASTGDPLGSGVAASFAHPGRNVTGLTSIGGETEEKRFELLREIVPGVTRIALMYNLSNPVYGSRFPRIQALARPLNVEVQLLDVRKPEDFGRAFDAASAQRADALLVSQDGLITANRQTVVELAAKHRLPAIYQSREFVDGGGVVSYGVTYQDLYRRAASYVDKILKGAKPADLPIEAPTKFELVINLKTAKALGLEISREMIARADEVIE